jgi:hypothetical protein
MAEQTISLTLKEYEELIEFKTKANQYKKFLIDNSNNNQMTKALIIIEGKNLYQLIKENEKENKEEK